MVIIRLAIEDTFLAICTACNPFSNKCPLLKTLSWLSIMVYGQLAQE